MRDLGLEVEGIDAFASFVAEAARRASELRLADARFREAFQSLCATPTE